MDAARVYALNYGIDKTDTMSRLRLAGRTLNVASRHVEATVDAFHFLQLLRLRVQDEIGEQDSPNRLDPDTLNEVDQRMLKEAFRQARKLQVLLARTYDL